MSASTHVASDFFTFDVAVAPSLEVVQGLIREKQIGAFAGPFGIGKSPSQTDLAVHVAHGIPWCGRDVSQRPVIQIDFETPQETYIANVQQISKRLGVPIPEVPRQISPFLYHGDMRQSSTQALHAAVNAELNNARFKFLESLLTEKPNAFLFLDPIELFFHFDTSEKKEILRVYSGLRSLLTKYPHATILNSFNLRKEDRHARRCQLLVDPRTWLEEVCGSLDLMNRCDVRLGMDTYDEECRVINGIRRGEEMVPLVIRPVEVGPEVYAGFELAPARLESIFTKSQIDHWYKLSWPFRFEDVADKLVPRSSLSRLLKRASLAGLARERDGLWRSAGGTHT